MRTLIDKEIRLLFPAFLGALALAVVPVWVLPARGLPDAFFLFGILILALSTYGREVGLRTLSFVLAQPSERVRIWWIKVAVLALFVALAFEAWWLSCSFCSIHVPACWVPPKDMANAGVFVAVFAAGGLWMTLLFRQVAAAFWLTFLIPMAMMTISNALGAAEWMGFTALGLYSVAAFFLARWQFLHLQDTAWTGGVIAFGGRRALAERSSMRERRPWAALFWKEVQLQQVTLLGMGCLLVLSVGAVALKTAAEHVFGNTADITLAVIFFLWCFAPVLAGSQSVAEERKLGTMEAHLCLPLSHRVQWLMKLMVVLVIGGLPAGVAFFYGLIHGTGGGGFDLADSVGFVAAFLGLALAGFYGSTLTSGVLPAIAAAVVTLLAFCASLVLAPLPAQVFGFQLWQGLLLPCIGCPVLVVTLLWLTYRNFRKVSETSSLWQHNALSLAGMLALIFGLTTAIYHRAWEWLTPLEPPHGAARLSLEKPPVLRGFNWRPTVLLPDGRLWFDFPENVPTWKFHGLWWGDRWKSQGCDQFAPDSNWVDSAATGRETVGIRSDGTLWIADKPRGKSASFIQFGHDTNWQNVVGHRDLGIILLKRDGTLWNWISDSPKGKQERRSLREFQPRQLGQDSDWARLLWSPWTYAFAWKADGRASVLHPPFSRGMSGSRFPEQELVPGVVIERLASLDNVRLRNVTRNLNFVVLAGVRDDGTLWFWDCQKTLDPNLKAKSRNAAPPSDEARGQIGKDSDWAEVASTFHALVARKTDGSLWKWDWESKPDDGAVLSALQKPPVRLGTHSDWVALSTIGGQFLTLAADGTLWSWPYPEPEGIRFEKNDRQDSGLYLAASRKPDKIENIFGARE